MKYQSYLIKPASSSCNLKCKYCFYFDEVNHRDIPNYGIMKKETMELLIDKALNHATELTTITFCFQGGEPTCANIQYFKNFTHYVDSKKQSYHIIQYSIQTNATLLNDEWFNLFKKYHFLVGISLDGYQENHNYFRGDTFKTILKNIQILKQRNIEYNILTVLTHELSKKPEKLYNFYKKHDFKYIQLIPCLPSLNDDNEQNKYSLTPKDFANFYISFFNLWLDDYKKGIYRSITLFDNIIPMYANIRPSQCGMLGNCAMQFVIESNGNIYPCDFYALDQYLLGNIHHDSYEAILKRENLRKFFELKPKGSLACDQCEFFGMCHKNCKRLQGAYYDENYCGYQEFLRYSRKEMEKIARKIK